MTVLALVEASLGIALLPTVIADIRPRLPQVAIKGRAWTWTIAAQALAPAAPNPAARALWDMLPTLREASRMGRGVSR